MEGKLKIVKFQDVNPREKYFVMYKDLISRVISFKKDKIKLEGVKELVTSSWQLENRPVKAYDLKVFSDKKVVVSAFDGNKTSNYKGSTQRFSDWDISFKVYY